MASVWKRLQRVNKRAAKFQYTASYHRIDLETSPKWKPTKLSIVWTRRSRRVVTEPMEWEPSLKDPIKGCVLYPIPENRTVTVTLFKDSRTNELEDKDWTFVLEDVSPSGKRRKLASSAINMKTYASMLATARSLVVPLNPIHNRVASVNLHLTLHCVLLREGSATDEDMQSLASLLSVNNNSDIAVLEDLDEDEFSMSDNSTRQMLDFRQQMEEMTHSLTISDIATPNSVQSLNFDNSRTPTAPLSPLTPVNYPELPTPKNESVISSLNNLLLKPLTKPKDSEIIIKDNNINIKPTVFKTKHLSKLNLKPLELKTNLNDFVLDKNDNRRSSKENTPVEDQTPVGDGEGFPRHERDKNPVRDLLEWCKEVTSEYKSCKVTNLTTSWRSGLAFCAIIHHFRPDLIDFSGLQPQDAESNLRIAFEASAKLGVSQVITVNDILDRAPDKLAIMTHLFQLRAHFTGNELQVEQLGADGDESSYLVGRHDTDEAIPRELFSREVAIRRSKHQYTPNIKRLETPRVTPDVDKLPLSGTIDVINRESPPARPEKLMTRKELTDPFGSDDEDEQVSVPVSMKKDIKSPVKEVTPLSEKQSSPPLKSPELPKPTPQLLSRHDELKERARQLLEATKREAREGEINMRNNSKEREDDVTDKHDENIINGDLKNGDVSPKQSSEEERQAALRERARKLIANARAGIVSPTSPSRPAHAGTVEIISRQSVLDEIAAAGGIEQLGSMLDSNHSPGSPKSSLSPDRSVGDPLSSNSRSPERNSSPLHTFSGLMETISPTDENGDEQIPEQEQGSYIQSEMFALEQEQSSIDERAAALEKELRYVMQQCDHTEEEDRLMAQWFHLVNKKNALLRRQMQLNILEQEEDLSRRCELLARELRLSLAVDEWRKTSGQKRRERLLLQELLSAVNKRDRLVQEMDEQERAIADDDEIERNLLQVEIQKKNNCIIQ